MSSLLVVSSPVKYSKQQGLPSLETMPSSPASLSYAQKGNILRDQNCECNHVGTFFRNVFENDNLWPFFRGVGSRVLGDEGAETLTASTPGISSYQMDHRLPRKSASVASNAVAANLSSGFPKTPQKVTQNSAKKRRQVPDFSRHSASPGHGEKMSMIFRDASAVLQEIRTPSCKLLPNSKMSRLPLSQARSMKFGTVGFNDTQMIAVDTGSPNQTRSRKQHHKTRTQQPDAHPSTTNLLDQPSSAPFPANQANILMSNCGLTDPHRLPSLSVTSSSLPLSFNASQGSQFEDEGKEPISSGFASPSAKYSQPIKTPKEVKYPQLEHWLLPHSSSGENLTSWSGSGPLQSYRSRSAASPSQGPENEGVQSAKVESWLKCIQRSPRVVRHLETRQRKIAEDEVADINVIAFPNSKYTMPEEQQYASITSSNKENISPGKSSPSPLHTRIPHLTTPPSHFRNTNTQTAPDQGSILHLSDPLTPQSYLSLPPKRKKPRQSGEGMPAHPKSGEDFTIHDDQIVDALAQLSPDVELRRKGRRPKRERCVSYWDEDILPPSSPSLSMEMDMSSVPVRKGQRVLGESQRTAEMTREKPFTAEAENAAFQFQV